MSDTEPESTGRVRTVHVLLEQPEKAESWIKRLLRHPLAITLVGSLGAAIVLQYWQATAASNERLAERSRQQSERRFALVQDVAMAFSDTVAANEDVVFLYERRLDADGDSAESAERWRTWREASTRWRGRVDALMNRLSYEFSVEEAATFDDLSDERHLITNKVSNLRPDDPEVEASVAVCKKQIVALKAKVREFTRSLAIKAGSPGPPTPRRVTEGAGGAALGLASPVLALGGAWLLAFDLKSGREAHGFDTTDPHPRSWRFGVGLAVMTLATFVSVLRLF